MKNNENITLVLFFLMIFTIILVIGLLFDDFSDASYKYQIEQQKEKNRIDSIKNRIDSINNENTIKINYIDSMYRVLENEKKLIKNQ